MIAALCALINRLESSACMLVKKALLLVDEMDVYDYGILISTNNQIDLRETEQGYKGNAWLILTDSSY